MGVILFSSPLTPSLGEARRHTSPAKRSFYRSTLLNQSCCSTAVATKPNCGLHQIHQINLYLLFDTNNLSTLLVFFSAVPPELHSSTCAYHSPLPFAHTPAFCTTDRHECPPPIKVAPGSATFQPRYAQHPSRRERSSPPLLPRPPPSAVRQQAGWPAAPHATHTTALQTALSGTVFDALGVRHHSNAHAVCAVFDVTEQQGSGMAAVEAPSHPGHHSASHTHTRTDLNGSIWPGVSWVCCFL